MFSLIGDPLFILNVTTSVMGFWPFGGWTPLSRRALNSAILVLASPHLLVASASSSIIEGELFYPEIFQMITPLCTYQGGRDGCQSWGEEDQGEVAFQSFAWLHTRAPSELASTGPCGRGSQKGPAVLQVGLKHQTDDDEIVEMLLKVRKLVKV